MAGNGDTGQCVSRGGGGSPPIFRLADIGSSIVFGATTAINLNGIHDVLERSGALHGQWESLEPASELEAKRPPPQPKMTGMGGGGGEMIKVASVVDTFGNNDVVDTFGNNDVIHRGGSSLAGGVATTTTTNKDAAAAKLLPSDEDAAMPSYSRRRPIDDKLAALDVENMVVCQRPIDDNAPYPHHYKFVRNRHCQGASDHDGRAPLQMIKQQNNDDNYEIMFEGKMYHSYEDYVKAKRRRTAGIFANSGMLAARLAIAEEMTYTHYTLPLSLHITFAIQPLRANWTITLLARKCPTGIC